MKCIIIDDEPLAHKVIISYCDKLETIQVLKSFHSALDALSWLNDNDVDLVFLDINMPVLKGLDFVRTLDRPPMIIITSAYQEYALESYELEVVDYLLKPFDFSRFVKAINKATKQKKLKEVANKTSTTPSEAVSKDRIFVKSDKKMHQIQLDEILFLESAGSYVKIHLADQTIMVLDRLTNFETSLGADNFIRVHKSFIVAIDKIDLIEGNLIHIDQNKVPIGQTYKMNLNRLF